MGDEQEQEDIREKVCVAIEAGKRAMEASEQMMADASKVRAAVKSEAERQLPNRMASERKRRSNGAAMDFLNCV
jgi:hypothetical protein